VAKGLAMTILPRSAIPRCEDIRILRLILPSLTRTDGLITRRGVPLSKPAHHLRRLVLRHAAVLRAADMPREAAE
jgi:hypothetical protein